MKSTFSRIRFLHCFKPEGSHGQAFRRDLPVDSDEHLTYRNIAGELSPISNSKKGVLVRAVKAVLARRIREKRRKGSSKSYVLMNYGRTTIADFQKNKVTREDDTLLLQSEVDSSLDQADLPSESQEGVAHSKGGRRRRKKMICAFIVVLSATVFLGRSWAMLLASIWICIACIYISLARGTNKA